MLYHSNLKSSKSSRFTAFYKIFYKKSWHLWNFVVINDENDVLIIYITLSKIRNDGENTI